MELNCFFQSIIDQDTAPIVVCDLDHTVLYLNATAAKRYGQGYALGSDMVGKNLLNCHNSKSRELIENCLAWFASDEEHNIVHESYNPQENKDVYIVALRDKEKKLIGYYEKHEYRTRDTSKFYDFI